MNKLTHITLSGYKSIEQMSLDLGPLNVLIGPNGAGKSNFVSFFQMLGRMMEGTFQAYVGTSGGADTLLFYGKKVTAHIESVLTYKSPATRFNCDYHLRLSHAVGETLVVTEERIELWEDGAKPEPAGLRTIDLTGEHLEAGYYSRIHKAPPEDGEKLASPWPLVGDCRVFQFHDTSPTSKMRGSTYIHDNQFLRSDGANLAAILYKLRETKETVYRQIVQTIRQVAPWFGDFVIEPLELNKNNLLLNWREKDSDLVFGPHQISDGTLRAIALITLLLQPREELPALIVIDEPELGLHPHAIVVLASLVEQAACHCQIILATQSTCLLDEFEAGNVIVVDRDDRKSTFKRLEPRQLDEWLKDYSLSELWEKNVLGGGPA